MAKLKNSPSAAPHRLNSRVAMAMHLFLSIGEGVLPRAKSSSRIKNVTFFIDHSD